MEQTQDSKVVRWDYHTHFMGLDWAKEYHEIVVLDRKGRIVLDLQIDHNAEGWHHLRQ